MQRHRSRRLALAVGVAVLPFIASGAAAQIVVSANDNKQVLVDGVTTVAENPAPDTVTIIDLGARPPRIVGEIQAPNSVQGPPQNVAVARDESFVLVASAMKHDPADAKKLVPDNRVSVIDLKASPPGVLATVQAGAGASGVSINRAGTLALVANRADGTVSVFTISGKTLTAAGTVDLGNPRSGPCHVAFLPGDKAALVTRDGDHKISLLAIDGDKVDYTKQDMVGGIRPYSLDVSAKGDVAVVGNQGGGLGDTDVINVVDLKAHPPRIVDTIAVGQTPEGIGMSADGAYVAITVMNGSNRPRTHQAYNDFGLVKVFRIADGRLSPVAEAKVGHWCQGIAFSQDSSLVAVQCMVEKEVQLLAFDGKELRPAGAMKVSGGPAGLGGAAP